MSASTGAVKSAGRGSNGGRNDPDDIDEIAVERAIAGDVTIRLRSPEIALAVAVLTRRGFSQAAVARRIGVSSRTVARHCARRKATT